MSMGCMMGDRVPSQQERVLRMGLLNYGYQPKKTTKMHSIRCICTCCWGDCVSLNLEGSLFQSEKKKLKKKKEEEKPLYANVEV